MLDKGDLLKSMDLVLSNQDVANPKPHPEIYLKAFERLGLKPEEVVIVEDSHHGIMSAKASGAHVLEVSGFDDVNYDSVSDFIRRCK